MKFRTVPVTRNQEFPESINHRTGKIPVAELSVRVTAEQSPFSAGSVCRLNAVNVISAILFQQVRRIISQGFRGIVLPEPGGDGRIADRMIHLVFILPERMIGRMKCRDTGCRTVKFQQFLFMKGIPPVRRCQEHPRQQLSFRRQGENFIRELIQQGKIETAVFTLGYGQRAKI